MHFSFGLSYLLQEAAPVASVHCPQGMAPSQPGAIQPCPQLPPASAWPHSMAWDHCPTLTGSILTPPPPITTPFPILILSTPSWSHLTTSPSLHRTSLAPATLRTDQILEGGGGVVIGPRGEAHLSLFLKYPLTCTKLGPVFSMIIYSIEFSPFPIKLLGFQWSFRQYYLWHY